MLLTVQLSVAVAGDTIAFGSAALLFTTTDAVAVQPLAGFVTVTVYVPAVVNAVAAVVTPPPQL